MTFQHTDLVQDHNPGGKDVGPVAAFRAHHRPSSCRTSQTQEFSPCYCMTIDTGANDFHISFAQCSSVQLPSDFENDSRTPWVSFIKGS